MHRLTLAALILLAATTLAQAAGAAGVKDITYEVSGGTFGGAGTILSGAITGGQVVVTPLTTAATPVAATPARVAVTLTAADQLFRAVQLNGGSARIYPSTSTFALSHTPLDHYTWGVQASTGVHSNRTFHPIPTFPSFTSMVYRPLNLGSLQLFTNPPGVGLSPPIKVNLNVSMGTGTGMISGWGWGLVPGTQGSTMSITQNWTGGIVAFTHTFVIGNEVRTMPEPGSATLLGIGAFALVAGRWWRLRRRRGRRD